MADTLNNFRDVWSRTSLVQRALLLAILMACGAVAVVLVLWARKPDMTMLYTGLAPEEAGKIVDKIRDGDTPYELRNGGTTILVPSEKVYSLRLLMAGQGMPKGDQGGYRILDEEKLGASPFTQRINYVRAVEGELAKTICMLEGVNTARVHVVKPEGNIFAGKDKEASATVVLALRSGGKLTSGNVAAIVHLISGSIEGLSPEKVVVVDSQGALLHGEGGNELAKKAGTFLDYKSQVEDYLARKAQDMLISALGPGRASVRVDATIETVSLTSTTETYDPAKKVASKEETKSSATTPPSDPNARTGAGNKEEVNTTEYLVSRVMEQKSELPGTVKSLTVAAFVDLSPPEADPNATTPPPPTLTVADVEAIIRSAIGPLATKENVKVVNTSFYKPTVPKDLAVQEEARSKREFYLEIAGKASLGLVAIGALLALKIMGGSRKKGAAGALAPAALEGQGAAMAGVLTAEGETNPQQLRTRIMRTLQENPEEVKRLFLSWVESDRNEV
ncbi:MAG: flagellar basal-body MS-ring/collar protein FliF [Phycisphaerae bacterium]